MELIIDGQVLVNFVSVYNISLLADKKPNKIKMKTHR